MTKKAGDTRTKGVFVHDTEREERDVGREGYPKGERKTDLKIPLKAVEVSNPNSSLRKTSGTEQRLPSEMSGRKLYLVVDEPIEIYGDFWVSMKNISDGEATEITPEFEEKMINNLQDENGLNSYIKEGKEYFECDEGWDEDIAVAMATLKWLFKQLREKV